MNQAVVTPDTKPAEFFVHWIPTTSFNDLPNRSSPPNEASETGHPAGSSQGVFPIARSLTSASSLPAVIMVLPSLCLYTPISCAHRSYREPRGVPSRLGPSSLCKSSILWVGYLGSGDSCTGNSRCRTKVLKRYAQCTCAHLGLRFVSPAKLSVRTPPHLA